jgi:hypothetical protein
MGYFPPVLRLRPVAGSVPPQFEVAEILNLQAVRDRARGSRYCGLRGQCDACACRVDFSPRYSPRVD